MATLFTKIIKREIPGYFIYEDEVCVSFLTIEPLTAGHALVVPREEIDQWTALDQKTLFHLMMVAQKVGQAQQKIWNSKRIGLEVQGYGVPHVHVHVWPTWSPEDHDHRHIERHSDQKDIKENADKLKKLIT